nr:hypothetical protein [Tanacetum cinerariifolium]
MRTSKYGEPYASALEDLILGAGNPVNEIILETYGDTITLKRRCDDADKDEEPSAGSDRGSKRRREGKEPESTSAPKEKASKTIGKSTEGSKYHQKTASEFTPFYEFAVNRESARDVYSKCRIIAVTELQIVEWHNYKHLDSITVRKDDDKLYKFKEGNFKRLHIQDIKDMLLLLVQVKLTNLTVEERFAFNVSLRMFTRSIVIQRRVEDLQLAKDEEDHAKSGNVCWWEIVWGRLQNATTNHMIYHMTSLSYKVNVVDVESFYEQL